MHPMPRNARALALQAVKTTAAVADRVHPPRRGVVVLIYHRVEAGSGLQVDLPAGLFDEQMHFLAERRRACTLSDALVALARDEPPDRDPVVVTFDDGTADFAERALPVLERHRVPVTLYVATDFVERQRPFPNGGTPLSWAALGDAVTTGLVSVGSHTDTHAVVDGLSSTALEQELDRSTRLIEDRLQTAAHDFAYPKGVAGASGADAAVRRRFRSAALGAVGANPYGRTDPYRLARSPIQRADGMRWFARKVDGGMSLEGTLRRALNRRRYSGAIT
jgi:peptidoglycan/xylan/chitin deacetylase (PgdA/CDA1 family)